MQWRIVNTFHDFNTTFTLQEPIHPTVELGSCKTTGGPALAQLLPDALTELQK
jgi:hypothetical protein